MNIIDNRVYDNSVLSRKKVTGGNVSDKTSKPSSSFSTTRSTSTSNTVKKVDKPKIQPTITKKSGIKIK